MAENKNRVCPVSRASGLEHWIRRLLQNPKRILGKHVKEGMTVLDFGCGPGLFSIEMAKMVGSQGRVFAVDLQQGMLDRLAAKIEGTELASVIRLHKSEENSIGLGEKVDFALAFYVVHEVPNQTKFFEGLKSIMKPGARLLVVEPNFHVSKEEFEKSIAVAKEFRFEEIERPRLFLSRSVLLGLQA